VFFWFEEIGKLGDNMVNGYGVDPIMCSETNSFGDFLRLISFLHIFIQFENNR